ncbi:sugar ABC transporter permease [Paenibacillus hunanensis]|uniref:carbohydrate ABC transporter permease n=1 Tax=Paenibacillus hunanensis TaxID=539262 RepID=UPI002A699864|nr:sugar ABC transporter permease [Paenibacillus hunanensis]WPP43600.1 sugar ABC transporter permease [Paenibacillus hunanensis]
MMLDKNPVRRWLMQFFFTGPTIFFFALAVLVPFAYGLYMTFNTVSSPIDPLQFAGLSNYREAFQDERFWDALWLTVKFVLATVILINMLGFLLAFLVTSGVRLQNFFRTALFTPNLIGGLVLGYIWQFIFVQTLPALGDKLGIESLRLGWLGDETMAFWAIVLVSIWQSAGYMMIIFVAGLVNVPKDVLEAATIDGANGWQRLRAVTLPLMVPSFVVTVFLTLKNAFMVYDLNYSLTAGGPYGSTTMVSMQVVQKAFNENNYGVGQAEAFVLFVIVAVITGLQVYFSKRLEVSA